MSSGRVRHDDLDDRIVALLDRDVARSVREVSAAIADVGDQTIRRRLWRLVDSGLVAAERGPHGMTCFRRIGAPPPSP